MKDSNVVLPGVRRQGHRNWFLHMAHTHGYSVSGTTHSDATVEARIEHARWIADCPSCNGAENVTLDDPVFLCLGCGNEWIEGQFATVRFPEEGLRAQVEEVLFERKYAHLRNWLPFETVDQLRAENAAHPNHLKGIS